MKAGVASIATRLLNQTWEWIFLEYVIEMLKIRKEFGNFVANDNIALQLRKGEIHALLGVKGAGKSTLMNILFGLYQPEAGEIRVRGEKVNITSPHVANDLGIGMVHQHFMLVQNFTVTESIILGAEPRTGITIDRASAREKVRQISEQYGLAVAPDAKIEDISVGMQQRVEILKTLYRGADILIFDEPSAVLTPQEIKELIQIMNRLIAEGKTIILITHKLKEIMEVADRCTTIRRGKYIGTVDIDETMTQSRLAEMMVGREVIFNAEYSRATPQELVLDIKNLVVKDGRGIKAVDGLNLDIRAGEIVRIAGIDGNGQTELIEAITGLRKADSGEIFLNNKSIKNLKPRKVTESGVGHIPQDRHKHGLVLDYSIGQNMVLQTYYKQPYTKAGVMNYKQVMEKAKTLIEKFDVRTPSPETFARALSGGNQQKAIIAREVDR
jgi:simple sugar transport system ATP-binding protein